MDDLGRAAKYYFNQYLAFVAAQPRAWSAKTTSQNAFGRPNTAGQDKHLKVRISTWVKALCLPMFAAHYLYSTARWVLVLSTWIVPFTAAAQESKGCDSTFHCLFPASASASAKAAE